MRIAIGADHAGFALKEHLVAASCARLGHEVDDRGTHSEAPVDYPAICADVGRAVVGGRADRGIVLGGSGQGEQIAANKVPRRARGALQRPLDRAPVARAQRRQRPRDGRPIVAPGWPTRSSKLWLDTPFEGGRHQRRIDRSRHDRDAVNRSPVRHAPARPGRLISSDMSNTPTLRSRWRALARDRPRIARRHRATSGTGRTPASS